MILDGKLLASTLKENLAEDVQKVKEKYGRVPKLAVVLVGDDTASQTYVKNKEKACKKVGIDTETIKLPCDVSATELQEKIKKLNTDDSVDGILLQLPLPEALQEQTSTFLNMIDPQKDVDGFTLRNKEKFYCDNNSFSFIPCTPFGIVKLLQSYQLQIEGKHVVIVGRSDIVGRPLAWILLQLNATVTVCHSHTYNLAEITKTADILISAVGKPNMITADMVKDGAVVIDVGINKVDGKLCGDVKFDEVEPKVGYITPVPGGVGPMTITMLLANTIVAMIFRFDGKDSF